MKLGVEVASKHAPESKGFDQSLPLLNQPKSGDAKKLETILAQEMGRRRFLKFVGLAGISAVTPALVGCGGGGSSGPATPAATANTPPNSANSVFNTAAYINGWNAVSDTFIANTWRNGQPLKLGLTDVVNTQGEQGVRFAYQKLGQSWTMAVISGSSMEALRINQSQIIERSWLGDAVGGLTGWARDFFGNAKNALKSAIQRIKGFVTQVVQDTILGLVKKFLQNADGVLKEWIDKIFSREASAAALILVTLVTTKGGPREKLIAVLQAYLAAVVADAAVEAIYAAYAAA